MAIHVANVILVQVDSVTGNIFTKNGSPLKEFTTIQQKPTMRPRDFSTEFRMMPNDSIPNTADYPTIPDYLVLEDGGGFKLAHMDQTYIITQS